MKKTLLFAALLALVSCTPENKQSVDQTLKSAYKDYFPIGVALGGRTMGQPLCDSLVAAQFSSVTAENYMKPMQIARQEGVYDFAAADKLYDFAAEHGMKMRGHTLLWHASTPAWFFAPDADGNQATKELVLKRLEGYIKKVVGHYKGRVYCWDVVNEALSDKEGGFLREDSPWNQLFGSTEYIEKAFIYAHEADPDALLFYNDYSVVYPSKQPQVLRLVKELQAKGVPIHGVGMQAHWDIYNPSCEQVESTIEKFKELGLQVHITELDLKTNKQQGGGQLVAQDQEFAVYELTPELEAQQSAQYKMLFETFRKHKDVVRSVTFWNLHDGATWLDERKNNVGRAFPLLFDENLQTKEAYDAVVNF